jgi:hypothetical protein
MQDKGNRQGEDHSAYPNQTWRKNMREIEYQITVQDESGLPVTKKVRGYLAFVMFGFAFGVHYEADKTIGSFDDWVITELSTGMCLTFNSPTFTKEQAIERGVKFLKKKGKKATEQAVAKGLEFLSKPIALTAI